MSVDVDRRQAIESLRFTPALLVKPPLCVAAVETTLEHFAVVTYWVDPSALQKHLHPRFEPVSLIADGKPRRSLVSVVTFLDRDFRFVACPWLKRSFGQTNYRAYVLDTETGEQVAWFFGTCLDSITVTVPRHYWKLPWHRAHMTFDCRYDAGSGRYATFGVTTESRWAPGRLAIRDSGVPPTRVDGVTSLEAGLVLLTHPLRGYYFRRDGALGSYAVWHDRTTPTLGTADDARYPLLERLELIATGDLRDLHSVLLQPRIAFTIYLPPRRIASARGG